MELIKCLIQKLKLTYHLLDHLNVQRMNVALNNLQHQTYNSEPLDVYIVKKQYAQVSSCIYLKI